MEGEIMGMIRDEATGAIREVRLDADVIAKNDWADFFMD
jgi:hypothetical protein